MITIRKQEWVTVEVDVTLPYYYHQNLSSEHGNSDIYGRIEDNKTTTIHVSSDYDGDVTIEFSTSEIKNIERSGLGCYFTKEFESDEQEFSNILEKAKKFVNVI